MRRALLAVSALVLAACGDDGSRRREGAATSAPTASVAPPVAASSPAPSAPAPAPSSSGAPANAKRGTVLATGLEAPGALVADGDAVYLALTKRGEIVRVPFKGERAVLATGLSLETPAHAPALADVGADLLALTSGTEAGVFEDGAVVRVPKAGGPTKIVAAKLRRPAHLVARGERFAFVTAADRGKHPPALWVGGPGGAKRVWQPEGSEGEICALALDGDVVYAVERLSEAETRVVRVAVTLDGKKAEAEKPAKRPGKAKAPNELGSAEEVVPSGTEVECALAVLDGELYFPAARGTLVRKVRTHGGDVRTAANVRSVGRVVALDADGAAVFGLAIQPAGSITGDGGIVRITATAFEWIATEQAGLQNLAVGPKGPVWSRWLEIEQEGVAVTR